MNKTHAAQVAAVGEVDRRQVFADDGAVSATSWLQKRTLQNYGQVNRLVAAAKRLGDFPALGAVFTSGRVSLAHVTQVTTATGRTHHTRPPPHGPPQPDMTLTRAGHHSG